jgi:hypothetical protein
MIVASWRTRPEDCQQKTTFKMKTLNFPTIFAHKSETRLSQYFQKT